MIEEVLVRAKPKPVNPDEEGKQIHVNIKLMKCFRKVTLIRKVYM